MMRTWLLALLVMLFHRPMFKLLHRLNQFLLPAGAARDAYPYIRAVDRFLVDCKSLLKRRNVAVEVDLLQCALLENVMIFEFLRGSRAIREASEIYRETLFRNIMSGSIGRLARVHRAEVQRLLETSAEGATLEELIWNAWEEQRPELSIKVHRCMWIDLSSAGVGLVGLKFDDHHPIKISESVTGLIRSTNTSRNGAAQPDDQTMKTFNYMIVLLAGEYMLKAVNNFK